MLRKVKRGAYAGAAHAPRDPQLVAACVRMQASGEKARNISR